jgi:hypothetical protein
MPLPLPKLNDDFPLLGEIRGKYSIYERRVMPTPTNRPRVVDPAEQWTLVREDATGSLFINGLKQFNHIPDPNKIGPRKPAAPKPQQQLRPQTRFDLDLARENREFYPLGYDLVTPAPEKTPEKNASPFTPGTLVRNISEAVFAHYGVMTVLEQHKGHTAFPNHILAGKDGQAAGLFCQDASEQRLYPCDADGWIPHTPGDPMPCPADMRILLLVGPPKNGRGGDYKYILGEKKIAARFGQGTYWGKRTSVRAWKPYQ